MKKSTRKMEQRLNVADGKETYMEAIGSIVLHLHSGFKLHLNNILYVPILTRNLISVRLLVIDGFGCNFGYMKCLLEYNDEDVDLAYLQDKLYLLSLYLISLPLIHASCASKQNLQRKLRKELSEVQDYWN
jgi:hypothetical protein